MDNLFPSFAPMQRGVYRGQEQRLKKNSTGFPVTDFKLAM